MADKTLQIPPAPAPPPEEPEPQETTADVEMPPQPEKVMDGESDGEPAASSTGCTQEIQDVDMADMAGAAETASEAAAGASAADASAATHRELAEDLASVTQRLLDKLPALPRSLPRGRSAW